MRPAKLQWHPTEMTRDKQKPRGQTFLDAGRARGRKPDADYRQLGRQPVLQLKEQ